MGGSVDEFPLLAAYGLYVADTAGNGNCLFNALSDQLYGTQSSHHEIRSGVIEYMREHADFYKQFIDVHPGGGVRRNPKRKNAGAYSTSTNYTSPTPAEINRVFESHLQQMARGGTYGDNMEIVAFSQAYRVNVMIYQRDFAYLASEGDENGERSVVHIAYHTWEHYSSIRNINGPHAGLPNVKPSYASPEFEKEQKEKLAKTSHVLPWMVNNVMQSLPYLADRAMIQKTLEECKGSVDQAVSKLLDAEERGSTSSAQESSSVGREHDTDGENFSGPNKKQDRRLSRATRALVKEKEEQQARELAVRLKSPGNLPPNRHSVASKPMHTPSVQEDAEETEEEDWENDPTYRDTESASASASDYSTASKPQGGGVRLKLSQPKRENDKDPPFSDNKTSISRVTNGGARSQQRQIGPKQKRITQRDRRDIKKLAQKAAAKERKQNYALGKAINGKNGGIPIDLKKEHSPAIETGIKTLYI